MDCSPPGSSIHGNSPGKNTGVGYHALLQGIFPTQRSNAGFLHCRQIHYWLSLEGRWQYRALTYCFSYLEPVCCSMSSSNCCFLTWKQFSQETGKVVWYSHLFQNFPQLFVIHTVKDFSVFNEAEVDVFSGILLLFLWSNGCWQFDLWFLSLSKFNLCMWKLLVHIMVGITNLKRRGQLERED